MDEIEAKLEENTEDGNTLTDSQVPSTISHEITNTNKSDYPTSEASATEQVGITNKQRKEATRS